MGNDFRRAYREFIQGPGFEDAPPGPLPDMENYLLADDGTFLGRLTSNRYDTDGIFNTYGQHGSKYAAESIFNEYGNYGGKYCDLSPFSEYASRPPKIYIKNKLFGYLSKNKYLLEAYDTDLVLDWIREMREFGRGA
jgi:hypothetical protein